MLNGRNGNELDHFFSLFTQASALDDGNISGEIATKDLRVKMEAHTNIHIYTFPYLTKTRKLT